MAEPPPLDELARRLLDLWQQQLSAWATDPQLARHMGAWLEAWSKSGGAAPRWPAPAGAAPDGGHLDLERIERRLAAVERRLAELEPKPRPRARKRPAGKARRRARS
jgi:hypothetical protein